MEIKQFRYNADNLAYVICSGRAAMAVDGGAVAAISAYIADHGLVLETVIHTHAHPDHTQGARELAEATGAKRVDHRGIADGATISLGRGRVQVLHTPGHTEDSVSFAAGNALITGDTLFNGTIGNCFSGDLEAFYRSLKRLMAFAPQTKIYGGHDYVRESMAFARTLEPDNPRIDEYLAARNPYCVVSTLADELAVNPYLRFNAPAMVALLKERGLAVDTEYQRWHSLMALG
ncbi:MAG: MBL fold metallo-hydrolase [Desulfobacterales bacterium]|nr:MBL fold metallo-hydrolase [Desulfobacterales bacterium]